MNNEPEFSISVTGSPKTRDDIDRFRRQSHIKALKIDEDVRYEEATFARISYRMLWSGNIKNWSALTYAHRAILGYLRKYMENWEYGIKVKLIESGE